MSNIEKIINQVRENQAYITEAKIEWVDHPQLDQKDDQKAYDNIPRTLKVDAPKREKPEGNKECESCEGSGQERRFTGRAGRDRETGVIAAQYIKQECKHCGGRGHHPGRHEHKWGPIEYPTGRNRGYSVRQCTVPGCSARDERDSTD
jgi:hypothetical protein